MDALVIDLTHGGVKIAIELEKMNIFENIHAYDIYRTLKKEDETLLSSYNINILYNNENLVDYINKLKSNKSTESNNLLKSDESLKSNKTWETMDLLIINPIHSPFSIETFFKSITDVSDINESIMNELNSDKSTIDELSIDELPIYELPIDELAVDELVINEITHHKAVKLILDNWKNYLEVKKAPIIEVTGVKGKTSVVAMLKEILISENPLILSSLGAYLYKNDKSYILKKNISITPASILETTNLAKKVDNPDCIKIDNDFPMDDSGFAIGYNSAIFENSLGVTGLGDVGVLTNLVENYSIAKDSSNAANAKKQVFDCDIVVIEKETLDEYYFDYKYYDESNNNESNINTFSFDDSSANIVVKSVDYGLNRTKISIDYNNVQTIYGNDISGSLEIQTFAPGKHHVMNVICALTTSLSLEIDKNLIISGLNNFKGIKGRTSLKYEKESIIIEEINPGINTKAIENSIEMIDDLNEYVVILGGKYGVTCEEIDEDKVALFLDNFLNKINNSNNQFNLVLTDDLGQKIEKKMEHVVNYLQDPIEAKKIAIDNNKNVLFIYRSNYSQINKR